MTDREFVIVNKNGLFIDQRKVPKMALISLQITDHTLTFSAPNTKVLLLLLLLIIYFL